MACIRKGEGMWREARGEGRGKGRGEGQGERGGACGEGQVERGGGSTTDHYIRHVMHIVVGPWGLLNETQFHSGLECVNVNIIVELNDSFVQRNQLNVSLVQGTS